MGCRKIQDKEVCNVSNKPLVLCIDDEQNILELLSFNLGASGYDTVTATSGAAGLEQAVSKSPALILLDLMLPDMDGTEVCRQLKAGPTTASIPIIMLTAKDSEVDKILGLELGADDYITKPFSVRELIARVKALLRRATPAGSGSGLIKIGSLTIDPENYEAFRNGEKLQLTLKEFELLKQLASTPGKVLTRDFLLDHIWGYEFYGETRTVDVHIRHIRQKLGDDAHYIETIRGVGYKFNDRQENRL
jgi:two-component system alkaline phosphatase synthesis response regulator PhoP